MDKEQLSKGLKLEATISGIKKILNDLDDDFTVNTGFNNKIILSGKIKVKTKELYLTVKGNYISELTQAACVQDIIDKETNKFVKSLYKALDKEVKRLEKEFKAL